MHLTDSGRETIVRVRTERTAMLADRIGRLDAPHRTALEAALPALEALVRED